MSSSTTEKNKKKGLKRILKWSGISFLLLLILLIILPFLFKDKIKELALEEANKMLKADLALGDFDLTFISTFPNMTLVMEDISLTGRNEFENVKLLDIGKFEAKLGFWSVIGGDEIEISSISLIEPHFDIRVLPDSTANYDIVKSDEEIQEEYPEEDTESSAFNLTLTNYEIVNGQIRYDDAPGEMFAEIVNLNHEGSGDLALDVVDFETKTSIDELTYSMSGVSYFSQLNFNLLMDILIESTDKSDKFTLKDNEMKLNELTLSFDGFYEMFEDYSDMDLKLNASQTSFKDLLSLIPVFYQSGYESMVTSGSMSLDGFIKGKMDDVNMPAFDIATKIKNASINYPDAPSSIDDIKINAGAKFPGGSNFDKTTIEVSDLHADFAGNTIDLNLFMSEPISDPYLKSSILANIDFTKIGEVVPLENQKFDGLLKSDLVIDGKISSLEKEDYESFKAEGSLALMRFHYESQDFEEGIDIDSMLFAFSPQSLELKALNGLMGKTDFSMAGNVENYMAYLFKDENLKGSFNYHSDVLDLDALMPEYSSEDESSLSEESRTVQEAVESGAQEASEPITIPKNIDFEMKTTVNKLLYDNMDIQNITGKVIIRDEEMTLENLSLNMLGGKIGLNGKYSTFERKNPAIDFSYQLENIDIQGLAEHFSTIEKLAPVAKHGRGKISSEFRMSADVKPDFEPIYNTLNGDGNLLTQSVQLVDFSVLNKLSKAMDISQIQDATFKNVDIDFSFADGKIKTEPFEVKLGKIDTKVEGTTSFEQEIDYQLKMEVPKSEVPKEILQIAEKAVAAAQNIPGFKMKELPNIIPVNAIVTNTVTDPKIKTDFKEQLMSAGGDIKDAVKDLVDEKIEELKDTVKQVVDDKIEEGKEELARRKQKILDDAQKQADRVKAEGKNLADQTRKEANNRAQQLIDEAGSNPLKKRTAEIAAEKIRNKGEESAKKIENEAQVKADNIMTKAREQADRLE
jgi:hypothetical protein